MTPPKISSGDDRYDVLGQVVELAAVMEISLRMAFCALIASEHAGVVAGAQETHWLIENCDALARHRQDVPAIKRDAIHAALGACRQANHDRNRLVHDAWNTVADGEPAQIRSGQRSYRITGRSWSAAEIQAAADAIAAAQHALLAAIEDALGTSSLLRAERLLAEEAAQYRG